MTDMNFNVPTVQEVRQCIENAFRNAGPFSSSDVAACPCDECEDVRRDFSGINTGDIQPLTIDHNFEKLPLFTPQVYRAVLPRFMLRGLDSKSSSSSWRFEHVLEFTVYALISGRESDWWIERHQDFTMEQVQAIWTFLRYAFSVDPNLFADESGSKRSDPEDYRKGLLMDSDVPKNMKYWYRRATAHIEGA